MLSVLLRRMDGLDASAQTALMYIRSLQHPFSKISHQTDRSFDYAPSKPSRQPPSGTRVPPTPLSYPICPPHSLQLYSHHLSVHPSSCPSSRRPSRVVSHHTAARPTGLRIWTPRSSRDLTCASSSTPPTPPPVHPSLRGTRASSPRASCSGSRRARRGSAAATSSTSASRLSGVGRRSCCGPVAGWGPRMLRMATANAMRTSRGGCRRCHLYRSTRLRFSAGCQMLGGRVMSKLLWISDPSILRDVLFT